MFRHKECKGTCGSMRCSEWLLVRLATVVKEVEILEAEGLHPRQIAELTDLEKDVHGATSTVRGGHIFSFR